MISHEHKCIFVASTNGRQRRGHYLAGGSAGSFGWFCFECENKHQTGGLQHLLASQIEQEVGAWCVSEYFKFSFVRNPFDKAVSQFRYLAKRDDLRNSLAPAGVFKRYLSLIQQKSTCNGKSSINSSGMTR